MTDAIRLPTLARPTSAPSAAGPTDAELLADHLAGTADAFGRLVHRHGPMVRAVCRRILGDTPDADDAFQATFVVLFRRANQLRHRDRLAGWLHGVAFRTAIRDAIETGPELLGAAGIYNMKPTNHNGTDGRSLILMTVKDGAWKLVQ